MQSHTLCAVTSKKANKALRVVREGAENKMWGATVGRLGAPVPEQCCVQSRMEVEKVQRRAAKMTEGMEQLLMRRDCTGWVFSHKAKEEGTWGLC